MVTHVLLLDMVWPGGGRRDCQPRKTYCNHWEPTNPSVVARRLVFDYQAAASNETAEIRRSVLY
ncbi:hypothetical protein M378DRAFT_174190 [Amanita muscaria Koide BX008]|uniref:Uncharacterized protein n=1 Tax=Amanita muscaria (strain Koide BX008) TaxID=946122 RepID=A0A0C2RWB1_AMAMK|nr:hypothetical protein M378DRAFT_174190 [Amanita muscaria Koide BX008]